MRRRDPPPPFALAAFALLLCAAAPAHVASGDASPPKHVRILAINDFHGQLDSGLTLSGRPVGGAGVLASYLRSAAAGALPETLVVHAGDLVGASPASSALLGDEPTVAFMNLFANDACGPAARAAGGAELAPSHCNVAGTIGNHELDHGLTALRTLLQGGRPKDPDDVTSGAAFDGAHYPTLSANLVDAQGNPVFPPCALVDLGGVRIGLVGALLRGAPGLVRPGALRGLRVLDEAEAVNRWVSDLRLRGAQVVVLLLHQGGEQRRYLGPTRGGEGAPPVRGAVAGVVGRLEGVDAVISAHTHAFTNAVLSDRRGRPVLVTQAFAHGTAYAEIDLTLDPTAARVVTRTARVETTWADAGPGLTPDPAAGALAAEAERRVAAITSRVVGRATAPLRAAEDDRGDSPLGQLVADAFREALPADVAFVNGGGLRADLPAGEVTWGALQATTPFGNELVRLRMTGAELVQALEAQWRPHGGERLHASGLTYTWSRGAPPGHKVSEVRVGGAPLDPAARYSVTVNGFLAEGGSGFAVFARVADRTEGGNDLDAVAAAVRRRGTLQPPDEVRALARP